MVVSDMFPLSIQEVKTGWTEPTARSGLLHNRIIEKSLENDFGGPPESSDFDKISYIFGTFVTSPAAALYHQWIQSASCVN